jgi:hypothetical protein
MSSKTRNPNSRRHAAGERNGSIRVMPVGKAARPGGFSTLGDAFPQVFSAIGREGPMPSAEETRTFKSPVQKWLAEGGTTGAAIDSILRAAGSGNDSGISDAIGGVADLLCDSDAGISRNAAFVLRVVAKEINLADYDGGIIQKLEEAFGSKNSEVAAISLTAVANLAESHKIRVSDETVNSVIALLAHPEEEVRSGAQGCLVQLSKSNGSVIRKLEELSGDGKRLESMAEKLGDALLAGRTREIESAESDGEVASIAMEGVLVPNGESAEELRAIIETGVKTALRIAEIEQFGPYW